MIIKFGMIAIIAIATAPLLLAIAYAQLPDTARNSFRETDAETEAMLIELAVAQIRNMTDPMITLGEDGTLIIMESPTVSMKIISANGIHPFTPENGYRIDNGILYAPNGTEVFP